MKGKRVMKGHGKKHSGGHGMGGSVNEGATRSGTPKQPKPKGGRVA